MVIVTQRNGSRAQEILNVVREIEKQICNERERLRKLNDAVDSIVKELDGMPPGGDNKQSRVEILAMVIVEVRERITALEKVKTRCADELQATLTNALIEVDELRVMLLRYVDCMHYRDIALALRYSESRVYQMHRRAIALLEDIWRLK